MLSYYFYFSALQSLDSRYVSGKDSFAFTCQYSGTDDPFAVVWKINSEVKADSDDDVSIVQNEFKDNERFE